MKRLLLLLMMSGLISHLNAQTSASSGTTITAITRWNNGSPTFSNQCLVNTGAQSANACAGSMTELRWFKFTVPTTISGNLVYTAAVKITVVPTGFDAIIDFYSGTAGAPVYEQCMNAVGSGVTEIMSTDPNGGNVVNEGIEYYFRVSSSTAATGCFNVGVEYYPGVYVRDPCFPNPCPDNSNVGYNVNNSSPLYRNTSAPGNIPINVNVQATRWRLVDTDLPLGSPGCTQDVIGVVSQINLSSFPCVCFGNSYRVYVQARYEGVWTGETLMRVINMEAAANVVITVPIVQCSTVATNSFLQASSLGPGSDFEWEWCTLGLPCTTIIRPVGNTQCPLSVVPCLKFNKTYNVRVRPRYCGQWGQWSAPFCIVTPPIPYAQITNCPTNLVLNGSVLTATFIAGINSYSWAFAPVNAGSPTIPIGPAIVVTTSGGTPNAIQIGTVGLAGNTTYRVQVKGRSSTCTLIQEADYGIWCLITTSGTVGMALEEDPELQTVIEKRDEVYYDFVENKALDLFSLAARNGTELTFNLMTQDKAGSGVITLMNAAGQLISDHPVSYADDEHLVAIRTLHAMASGLYFVRYSGAHGSSTLKIYLE